MGLTFKHFTDANAPEVAAIQTLYEEAFPACERRHFQQLCSMLSEPSITCCAVLQGAAFAGFYVSWQFNDFCFVEHLAVAKPMRGTGIGSQILQHLLDESNAKLILEIERPSNKASQRRIKFYQRLGFTLHEEYDYYQPPYQKGLPPVPLFLMASYPLTDMLEMSRISQLIRQEVYERFYE